MLQRFTSAKEVPIHLRIFNFLKNWMEKYWVDFYEDGDLRGTPFSVCLSVCLSVSVCELDDSVAC